MGQGDPQAARPIFDESHALFHLVGDAWGEAMTLYRLGLAAAGMGDPAAHAHYERSLELFRQVGDTLGMAVVLNALAWRRRRTATTQRRCRSSWKACRWRVRRRIAGIWPGC